MFLHRLPVPATGKGVIAYAHLFDVAKNPVFYQFKCMKIKRSELGILEYRKNDAVVFRRSDKRFALEPISRKRLFDHYVFLVFEQILCYREVHIRKRRVDDKIDVFIEELAIVRKSFAPRIEVFRLISSSLVGIDDVFDVII